MIARQPKWLYAYMVSKDIGNWPFELNNFDRIHFTKWCQKYVSLFEIYDEDERPNHRLLQFDVLVDNFWREQQNKRLKSKMKMRKESKKSGNVDYA